MSSTSLDLNYTIKHVEKECESLLMIFLKLDKKIGLLEKFDFKKVKKFVVFL